MKYNPDYRLVEMYVDGYARGWNVAKVQLVYGVTNNWENEGLEVYLYRHYSDLQFYRSYRYTDKVPKKYRDFIEELRQYVYLVPDGHKMTLEGGKLV